MHHSEARNTPHWVYRPDSGSPILASTTSDDLSQFPAEGVYERREKRGSREENKDGMMVGGRRGDDELISF